MNAYVAAFQEIAESLRKSLLETAYMVSVSLVISIVGGLLVGILLYAFSQHLLLPSRPIYAVVSTILNIICSIPFLIFMIFCLPLCLLLVGTKIGSSAVIVPLSIEGIAFLGRLAEGSLIELDTGILEAAISTGAGKVFIIRKALLPQALPGIIRGITLTAINLLGYSAMAGLIGGGGIGDLAYRYGFQRYNFEVMIICIVILILLVQILQVLGSFLAKKATHS